MDEYLKKQQFIGTGKVAELLKVSDRTIRNWADEGIINCIKDQKGNRLFSFSEVKQFAIKKGLI